MKLERFIVTFVMMNIVLMIAIVFSVKDFTVMEALSEIIYGQKTAPAHYALSPSKLKEEGFKSDNKEVFQNGMSEIYATTIISAEKIAKLNNLPPYEKGVEIVRMFSLMGDGECLSEPNIADKINQTAKKNGCSVDFAQIFTILATASGLDARIVSNGIHYGAEIYNGNKWIYIDPYFAMSASGKEGRMSYIEFSNAILNNGWIRFDYFGGENHCMNGKPIAEHPYFSDQELFASIYSLNGNNIFEVNKIESKYSSKPAFMKYLYPYLDGKPKLFITELQPNYRGIVRKYVAGLMAVILVVFIGTNIVLPAYYLTSLTRRRKSQK